jgi:hypothetical protein
LKCAGGFTIEHMENALDKIEGEVEVIKGIPKRLTMELIKQVI